MDKNELPAPGEFPGNSHCATCAHMDTYTNAGGVVFDRHTNGTCQKYPQGIGKPRDIIYNNAPCRHYKKTDNPPKIA